MKTYPIANHLGATALLLALLIQTACAHAQPLTNTAPILTPASPAAFGAISDPTNPAFILIATDAESSASRLTVTAVASSNPAVVPLANLHFIRRSGNTFAFSIDPIGVGYSTLTFQVTDPQGLSTQATLSYAASLSSPNPGTTRHHYGKSDASTAVAVTNRLMLVGDDEDQTIRLYRRDVSGLPLQTFNFTSVLGLTDLSGGVPREIDLEASTQVGNRIYWLGSHSNSSSGSLRPNRYRVFASELTATDTTANLTYLSRYDNLRPALIAWGDALGYNFTASAAKGKTPEDPARDGFNIEGLTTAANGTTFYLGFRAPLVPLPGRNLALIAPISNLANLIDGTATTPAIGAPILLDLGGRGIRSIERNAYGEFLILAGPSAPATGVPPLDFRLYYWTGNPADAPILFSNNLTALDTQGGSPEGIVAVPNHLRAGETIQLAIDNGDTLWYNDGVVAKDLPTAEFKKFRTERIKLGAFVE